MPGRIEIYVHSDMLTQNKGGAIVELLCETDFAAKTPEFIEFAKKLAKLIYGYGHFDHVWDLVPEVRADLHHLQTELKEHIKVGRCFKVALGETCEIRITGK